MSMQLRITDVKAWAVRDENGHILSVHQDKLDARIAAFRCEHLDREADEREPNEEPIYWG